MDEEKNIFSPNTQANFLVKIINGLLLGESAVIGIYGHGNGKTSLIDFVKEDLKNFKDENKILDFNPWMFIGHQNLIKKYFEELIKIDIIHSSKWAMKMIAKYLEQLGFNNNKFFKEKTLLLSEIKLEINKEFKNLKHKIVVIIDDLDMLAPQQVLDIFKMVKSVANFSNIIYVLAFDKLLVGEMISKLIKYDGDRYVGSIIQYEIDIPYQRNPSV